MSRFKTVPAPVSAFLVTFTHGFAVVLVGLDAARLSVWRVGRGGLGVIVTGQPNNGKPSGPRRERMVPEFSPLAHLTLVLMFYLRHIWSPACVCAFFFYSHRVSAHCAPRPVVFHTATFNPRLQFSSSNT